MKSTLQESQENEKTFEEKDLAVWDLGSPLYDSYEVVSLSHLIERHLMIVFPSLESTIQSNKIFPPPPPPDNAAAPATLGLSSSVAKGGHGHHRTSSALKVLSEIVRARLWRKRKNGVGDKTKDNSKPKKVKGGVVLRVFSCTSRS